MYHYVTPVTGWIAGWIWDHPLSAPRNTPLGRKVASMARRKRRAFGQVKTSGRQFEASYPTPVGYGDKFGPLSERQYRRFDTEAAADAWLYQERKLIELDEWSPVSMRKAEARRRREQAVTFGEYAEHWVETRRKPDGSPRASGTIKRNRTMLRRHINPYFGDTPMTEISAKQVRSWIDTTADTMRNELTARHNSFVLLKAIFNTAATEPIDDAGDTLIAKSPAAGYSIPRPEKTHKTVPVTDAQIWRLHDVIRDDYGRPDLAVVPLIGLFEGMRIGEVLALRRCDVLTDTDEISVTASVKDENELDLSKPRHMVRGATKTKDSVRTLPIAPELREALYTYMAEHVPQDPDAPLFRAPRAGGFLAENSFTEVYVKARERVDGMHRCRFHDLRHNLLTRVSGVAGVAVAKRIAGHSDVSVTGGYLDAVGDDVLRRALDGSDGSSSASATAADNTIAGYATTLAQLSPEVRAKTLDLLPADVAAKIMAAMIQQI